MKALIINCSPVKTGATAEIARLVEENISGRFEVRNICIDDYKFSFCLGCRSCHETAVCVQDDDIPKIIAEFEWADTVICVSPSYWADVPGQFKAFIDRCTPWCNTHEPHASLSPGKKGYAVVLRTGPNFRELEKLIGTIEHFYGHMEIERCGSLGLVSVEYKENVKEHLQEIEDFCRTIQ